MNSEECLNRAQVCFAMKRAHQSVTAPPASMDKACWLWLFVWAGMFE